MRADRSNGTPVLEYPKDLYGFTLYGVTLTRTSALHEAGAYTAQREKGGKELVVTHHGSKRFPWTIFGNGKTAPIAHARNLIHVAEIIAAHGW